MRTSLCYQSFLSPLRRSLKVPGRTISAKILTNADALLVRSVTQVDRQLINGSSVKFIGTATAGVDHIDQDYLHSEGAAFSHAPGCNARAVVEYVIAALDILAERKSFNLLNRKVGIVGYGQVGRRLYEVFEQLGVEVCTYDPFVQATTDSNNTVNHCLCLNDLIDQSDIICLHTPLTTEGPYPTHHLISTPQLEAMKQGTVLINAGRGPVIDGESLKNILRQRSDLTVALDVWEYEPDVDPELLDLVDIATPHIAGYSIDGKIRGTQMIYEAFCHHFELHISNPLPTMPAPALSSIDFTGTSCFSETSSLAIRAMYDIRRDDFDMRVALKQTTKALRRKKFDLLRKNYPSRREFSTVHISLNHCSPELASLFRALQFHV